jgi:hypothetical protein
MIKRRGESQIENLILTHKSLERKPQKRSNWGVLYIIRKIFLRAIKYCPHIFKKIWFEKDMKTTILGLAFENPEEKWHLDVVRTERHIVYYREGSGASSQRLRVVQSLCLRLCLKSSLLSPPHHFHSTYTNRPFFLVVQVDLILNFRLWVLPNPILEL